jgi:ribosomal protein L25 (general stress protein Ctc)
MAHIKIKAMLIAYGICAIMAFIGIGKIITVVFCSFIYLAFALYPLIKQAIKEFREQNQIFIGFLYGVKKREIAPILNADELDKLLSDFDKQAKENAIIRTYTSREIEVLKKFVLDYQRELLHTTDEAGRHQFGILIAQTNHKIYRQQKALYHEHRQKQAGPKQ